MSETIRWKYIFWYFVLAIILATALKSGNPIADSIDSLAFLILIGIFFIIEAIEKQNQNLFGSCELTRIADELKRFNDRKGKNDSIKPKKPKSASK